MALVDTATVTVMDTGMVMVMAMAMAVRRVVTTFLKDPSPGLKTFLDLPDF